MNHFCSQKVRKVPPRNERLSLRNIYSLIVRTKKRICTEESDGEKTHECGWLGRWLKVVGLCVVRWPLRWTLPTKKSVTLVPNLPRWLIFKSLGYLDMSYYKGGLWV